MVTTIHQGTQLRQERNVLILDQQAVNIPLLTELAECFRRHCL